MFKNKTPDGRLNISGRQVARLRAGLPGKVSQRALADRLQLAGLDIGKNGVQQIECGKRFVTDIELKALAQALGVTADALLSDPGPAGRG